MIEKLSYVRLGVADLARSAEFAERIVGLEPVAATEEGLALFRSDFRDHALALVQRAGGDGEGASLGLELRDEAAMAAVVERLVARGHKVWRGSAGDCAERRCREMAGVRLRGGLALELVVRPLSSGWRYHGPRDAGICGFAGVVIASTEVEADIALWCEVLGAQVTDYIGEGAYLAIDGAHHRVTILPSGRDGLLEMQFEVEGMDQVMQAGYFMQAHQVPVVAGPGRRPASGELFIGFRGPDEMLFGYVAEGAAREDRLARQFAQAPGSFCAWGSRSSVPEYGGEP
ncbi:VOC family protein [Oceanicola sp. 502str15]|uniref:VOC family protein n=1 Tax=Oceanicola sp. 502str15 TaxID=2696061 RepID=UPI002094A2DB|nr:oxidoreductase [Oceanicola sp. 502str15]